MDNEIDGRVKVMGDLSAPFVEKHLTQSKILEDETDGGSN